MTEENNNNTSQDGAMAETTRATTRSATANLRATPGFRRDNQVPT